MFSDELEKISWEETTKAIYSKTNADVRRALGKSGHLDVNEIYHGTVRQDNLHVRAALHHQFMYQFLCVLRFPYQ